uniref:Ubiquitin carboxyl-terminal hydrolase n=1 Tax=Rhabditophanes sp. KR3021 TaxID=114890 RepID=A0AC35TKD8_9BILA
MDFQDAGNWCLIESDPAIFTEMIRKMGVSGVQVEELYDLDAANFNSLHPIYGLIFLFKWRQGDEPSGEIVRDPKNVYFAQQVISNSCATQAIINLLLNIKSEDVKVGKILEEFKSFTNSFDPTNRGLCLSNSEDIRTIHNSFGRQSYFELENLNGESEEVFHFVAYLPINGRIYELDGLRPAPIDHGEYDITKGWMTCVVPKFEQRMKTYTEGDIHFSLMAVVGDKLTKFENQIEALEEAQVGDENELEIQTLRRLIEEETDKREILVKESIRRSHNYLPFLVELLKVLAKENKLVPLVEKELRKQMNK